MVICWQFLLLHINEDAIIYCWQSLLLLINTCTEIQWYTVGKFMSLLIHVDDIPLVAIVVASNNCRCNDILLAILVTSNKCRCNDILFAILVASNKYMYRYNGTLLANFCHF